jgi:FKBP-type peptidyl-prolyl cis-trans isomerase FkpA
VAAPKGQRIGIIIIAVVMIVGTLGSFAVAILATQNNSADAQKQQAAYAKYQESLKDYQKKVDDQATALSKKYYATFSKYEDYPSSYDIDSVTKLKTEDLKVGTGAKIGDDTEYAAYYIGWNPKGKVFDTSINGDALKAPIDPSQGLITGWTEGVKGMKIGGVRLVEIPSDKAYGEAGSGDNIPPNTPIKFIIMAIEKPEAIAQPEIPTELLSSYSY